MRPSTDVTRSASRGCEVFAMCQTDHPVTQTKSNTGGRRVDSQPNPLDPGRGFVAVVLSSAASGGAIHHRVRSSRVSGPFAGAPGFGSALVGFAPAGTGPGAVAIDPATHTLYVTDGFSYSGSGPGGDTVSVIDARRCNAQDLSRCPGPWPRSPWEGGSGRAERDSDRCAERHGVRQQHRRRHRLGHQRGDMQRDGEHRMRSDPGFGPGRRQASGSVRLTPTTTPSTSPTTVDTSVSMIDSATCNADKHGGLSLDASSDR